MAASQSQRKVASDLFTNDESNLSSATKYGDETENMSLVVKNDELIDEISMSDSDFEEELEEEPDDPPSTHFADATNKSTGENKFVSYSSLIPALIPFVPPLFTFLDQNFFFAKTHINGIPSSQGVPLCKNFAT